ncbi:MAG: helix-turn-helix transcriptional regulator [Oscillibacter sp.]|nr:helix-turn-helix transcriptional regulator [Oscillibacter sp.]
MNAIKAKRTQIGLSQTALAELLGVSQQAVAQWESDKAMPRKEAMVKLAALFNCTIDELYGRDPPEQGGGGGAGERVKSPAFRRGGERS